MTRVRLQAAHKAARDAGRTKLSFRLFDALYASTRYGGTSEATNGNACYTLQRKGLVRVEYPFAYATVAGHAEVKSVLWGP